VQDDMCTGFDRVRQLSTGFEQLSTALDSVQTRCMCKGRARIHSTRDHTTTSTAHPQPHMALLWTMRALPHSRERLPHTTVVVLLQVLLLLTALL
jgi:hypothetical protein